MGEGGVLANFQMANDCICCAKSWDVLADWQNWPMRKNWCRIVFCISWHGIGPPAFAGSSSNLPKCVAPTAEVHWTHRPRRSETFLTQTYEYWKQKAQHVFLHECCIVPFKSHGSFFSTGPVFRELLWLSMCGIACGCRFLFHICF